MKDAEESSVTQDAQTLLVYYDAACPGCVRDRDRYQRWLPAESARIHWVDVNGQEERLRRKGIDPRMALRELHVEDAQGRIHRELDAYVILLRELPYLRPLAWLLGSFLVRPWLSRLYHAWVDRRLKRQGRL